jgi:hypothetical protein
MPGRGAYLCRDAACWATAGRKKALEHALKVALSADLVAALAAGPAALTINNQPTSVAAALTGPADVHPDTNEGGPHGSK